MPDGPTTSESSTPSRRLTFFEGYERFPGFLDHPPRILDTAQILDELKAHVRSGWMSSGVVASTNPRKVRLLAPHHVYGEMYRDDGFGHANKFEKLAEQSRKEGWPTAAAVFQEVFETQYLPAIRFVEVGDLFEGDSVVLSVGSRRDVDTARLAVLLALDSPMVFSADSHLHRPGLATKNPEVVLHAAATMETSELSVYASVYSSVSAAKNLNRRVNQVSEFLDVPPALAWTVLAAAIGLSLVYALRTPERRAAVAKGVEPVAGMYVGIAQRGLDAQKSIEALAVPVPVLATLSQRVAKVLVDSGDPRSVGSIVSALSINPAQQPSLEVAVQRVLDDLPCFVRGHDGLWGLGQLLMPPGS
jgi:hypothetical protein